MSGAMIFTAPWRLDRAQRVDRWGRASHARQFIAVRELGDACPYWRRAPQMTGTELACNSIDGNLEYLKAQGWRAMRHD
jgi:hypothetical protein